MKFSLFAIFATVLYASVVIGAPSTPNSFEDLITSSLFDLGNKDTGLWLNLRCVREVLLEESSEQARALWGEYKAKLRKLNAEEWPKCKGISDIAEQQKCKGLIIEKSLVLYNEYLTKYIKIANWQKVLGGMKKIATTCVKKDVFDGSDDLFSEEILAEEDSVVFSLFDVEDKAKDVWLNLRCVRGVFLEESSEQVRALWGEYKAKLHKLNVEEWTKCKGISNIAEQQKCKGLVVEKSLVLYHEYLTKYIKIANWQKVLGGMKKIAKTCVKINA